MPLKTFFTSIKSAFKDCGVLMAARDDDDDDYNFASGHRRGAQSMQQQHYNDDKRFAEPLPSEASSAVHNPHN